jgi:VanZ family protein
MKPPALGEENPGGEICAAGHPHLLPRQRALARALLPLAWMAVLWWLSSIPGGPEKVVDGLSIAAWFQKLMHVVAYAILAAAWTWALSGQLRFRATVAAALVLTVGYAVVDEIHQAYVPGRTSAVTDVLIDLAGALIGIGVVTAARRRKTGRTGLRQD